MTLCSAQVPGSVAWTPVKVTVADHRSVSLAAGGFLKESLAGEEGVQLRTLTGYMQMFASFCHGLMLILTALTDQ